MPRPTDAQKEAGNYAMDRLRLHGLPITIENRKGTIRRGTSKSGHDWSVVMPYDYGYIRRTLGADGDQVDCFVGPNRQSQFVVVVNQYAKQTGVFDEVKVGLGYHTLEQAKAAYRQGYRGGHVPRAEFTTTTVQRLKEWLRLKQTWARFDLHARSARLTMLANPMKRLIQFRQATPKEEEAKPSLARKVAAGIGAAAVIGGFYKYASTRPDVKKHAARMKTHADGQAYAQGLRNQPAPRHTPAYDGGAGFDYGVKSAPVQPVTVTVKPKAKNREASLLKQTPMKRKFLAPLTPAERKAAKIKAGWKQVSQTTALRARVLLTQFQDRNDDGTLGVSTSPLTAYRKASRVVPWVGRAHQAAGDLGDMATGKEVKDPFYKKTWFKRAATTAAIGLPLLAASLARSGERKKADGVKPSTGTGYADKVDRLTHRAADAKRKVYDKFGLSAKLKPILLQAVVTHLKSFDYTDRNNWDLRDARGKSARVFAPGSKPRERREKDWNEKTENIRLVRNIAIAGTVAGVAGALHYRNKANQLNPKVPKAANIIDGVDFRKPKMASAKIRLTQFARKGGPALSRLIDATKANVSLPDRPDIPGEGAVKFVYGLPPKRRAGVLKLLGAGALAGTGVAAGVLTKRPKTGAALGGLGAGLILG